MNFNEIEMEFALGQEFDTLLAFGNCVSKRLEADGLRRTKTFTFQKPIYHVDLNNDRTMSVIITPVGDLMLNNCVVGKKESIIILEYLCFNHIGEVEEYLKKKNLDINADRANLSEVYKEYRGFQKGQGIGWTEQITAEEYWWCMATAFEELY